MRTNRLREVMQEGQAAVCGWLSTDSPYLAEVLSYSGYDAVTVDVQHGMFGVDRAVTLLQAVSAGPAVPLARCPSADAATIGKLLDAGAYGIICPFVDTVEQAEAFVRACRYPPSGERSFGPSRALLYGGPDYADRADETVLAWAMIESVTAIANLDAILATPGLDAVFVGPNDLALSMGARPGSAVPPPEVLHALEHVAGRARAAGKWVGAFAADAAMARREVEMGYHLVTPGNDIGILRQAVAERVAAVRGGAPVAPSEGGY